MADSNQSSARPDLVVLANKLAKIGTIEKCEGCGCYVDTIREFDAVLSREDAEAPAEARATIDELAQRHATTHGCIGCDPCYPVAVSNALYEVSGGESIVGLESSGCDVPALVPITKKADSTCGSSCGCETAEPPSARTAAAKLPWPIETGDYRLGDPRLAVAVATLASEDLYRRFSNEMCTSGCAICGKVFTENIGIEKLVKNVIANRYIRYLVLCGAEAKGHQTGACIKALHANGLDERGRIAGAPGKRPWIKTLTAAQVARFQAQVQVVDRIGCEDSAEIEHVVAELAGRAPEPMPEDVIAEGVPHYMADPAVLLRLDKAGFFIIHPKPEANWILVEHYENSGRPTCVVEGPDPAVICAEIIKRGLVSQLDHAAYLGRELERAKLSIVLGFPFAQDRALGELDADALPDW